MKYKHQSELTDFAEIVSLDLETYFDAYQARRVLELAIDLGYVAAVEDE